MSAKWIARSVCRAVTDERGAALVIVLIALVGLTALAAAGMMTTGSDLQIAENMDASTRAFYAADAGLQTYIGSNNDGTTGDTYAPDSLTTVTVTPRKLTEIAGGRVLYRITSTAVYVQAPGDTAVRTVSRVAIFSDGSIAVPASFTAASGFLKTGGAGMISGQDWASAGNPKCPDSPKPAVAGVKVPPSGYWQDGGAPVPDGDPPIEDGDTGAEMLADIGLDWDGIVNGGLISPDYTIPPDTWPNFGSLPSDEWPVIYVEGNISVSPSNSGRGTMIVRGNLSLNGSFNWDGAILVGGYITSNGYQTVQGATVAGLNILLGETPSATDIGNGNKEFKYDSCKLKQATQAAFGGLSEMPGTWSETF
ncbi:MAG: pilus assembly PilX family protein [Gemmatimonadota bacterium]